VAGKRKKKGQNPPLTNLTIGVRCPWVEIPETTKMGENIEEYLQPRFLRNGEKEARGGGSVGR